MHFLGFALVAPLRARREFHSIELQLKLNGPQEEAEAEEEEAEEGEETANLFFWGRGGAIAISSPNYPRWNHRDLFHSDSALILTCRWVAGGSGGGLRGRGGVPLQEEVAKGTLIYKYNFFPSKFSLFLFLSLFPFFFFFLLSFFPSFFFLSFEKYNNNRAGAL